MLSFYKLYSKPLVLIVHLDLNFRVVEYISLYFIAENVLMEPNLG